VKYKKRGDNVHEVQLCVVKQLYRAVLYVHLHLFFMFHYIQLCFMYIVTSLFIFHYTELYFMHIVTSFLCFTTQSCTSCTLSLSLYIALHTAVQKRGNSVHEVQLCVVQYIKKVTMYMKYSSVW
jgi:hypothetical protein